jgi:hypothetical protein
MDEDSLLLWKVLSTIHETYYINRRLRK